MTSKYWQFYGSLFQGKYTLVILGVVCSVLQAIPMAGLTWLISQMFDEVIPSGSVADLIQYGITIFILIFLISSFSLAERWINFRIICNLANNLKKKCINKSTKLSAAFYFRSDAGSLQSSVVHGSEQVELMSASIISKLVPSICITTALCIPLVIVNWQLTIILFMFFPFWSFLQRPLRKKLKQSSKLNHQGFHLFNRSYLLFIQMMSLIRTQGTEDKETQKLENIIDKHTHTSRLVNWYTSANTVIHFAMLSTSALLVLIVGGLFVIEKKLTMGQLLSFYVAVGLLKPYLMDISVSISKVIAGHESLINIYRFLHEDSLVPYVGRTQIPFFGRISIENISFGYNDRPILKEISLQIAPGKVIAICGPNGSGKSSLVNLILGFYKPQQGALYADEFSYEELDLSHLRKFIGVVPQQTFVFSGTVLENICYGYPQPDQEVIHEALVFANAKAFIDELPDGLQTKLGDEGIQFSGGQLQRLSIARALIKRPKLLILDEPTNHLDQDSIKTLIEGLSQISYKPAILLISHRAELISAADIIYLLKNGRLEKFDEITASEKEGHKVIHKKMA